MNNKNWSVFLQSVKKYGGTTKKTFTTSKAKTLNAPSPLNQCRKSREIEKIKNCTCFGNQQHSLTDFLKTKANYKMEGFSSDQPKILESIFLTPVVKNG